jgi:hypothetical protein
MCLAASTTSTSWSGFAFGTADLACEVFVRPDQEQSSWQGTVAGTIA